MNALMTVVVVAVVLFAWFCLIRVIPNCLVSLFRYRLWRLRDEVFDEVRLGKFHGTKQARELVRDIECFIDGANELSPLNIGLLFLTVREKVPVPDELIDMRSMDRRDKRRLTKHIDEFQKAIIQHVFFHTPSGWILTLPALPVLGIYKLGQLAARWRNKDEGDDLAKNARGRVFRASVGVLQAGEFEHHPLSQAV